MPARITRGVVVRTPANPGATVLAFASRFTAEEQIALDIAMWDHPDPEIRAVLRRIDKNLDRATFVRPSDPRTQMGVEVSVDVLIGAGLVALEDRAARIAALLAPPSPEEMAAG